MDSLDDKLVCCVLSILRSFCLIKVRERTLHVPWQVYCLIPSSITCYLTCGKRCDLGKARHLVGYCVLNAANALPRHLGPDSLAGGLPSHYLSQGDKVILTECASHASLQYTP
jgi:hypothetical protein